MAIRMHKFSQGRIQDLSERGGGFALGFLSLKLRSYSEISGGGLSPPESVRGCDGPAPPVHAPEFSPFSLI